MTTRTSAGVKARFTKLARRMATRGVLIAGMQVIRQLGREIRGLFLDKPMPDKGLP